MPTLALTTTFLRKAFEQKNELAIAQNVLQLGKCYLELANQDTEPLLKARLYRQAAIALNNALIRHKKLSQHAEIEATTQLIMDIKIKILFDAKIACTKEELQESKEAIARVQAYREDLHHTSHLILNEIETTLTQTTPKELNFSLGLQKINTLFLKNFDMYRHMLEQFSITLFKIIGNPPCPYAFAAVGSLGKFMPSNQSDLDLLLLIRDNQFKDYFKRYADLLSLYIISLGETPLVRIRTEEMEWMYRFCEQDHSEGCSIDVGGLPIEYGPYQLLGSPQYVLSILDAIKENYFAAIDASLYCPRLLLGTPTLLEEFQELQQTRLNEDKEIKDLKEISFALEQFHSVLDEEMYIKHEWLRQFVEGLVRLARFYKIFSTNPCEIILALKTKQIISAELANSMNQLYFLISFFLLRNYQIHKAQVQQILLHSQILPTDETFQISPGHTIRTAKGFFRHEVFVRKMPPPSEHYHLTRNKKVISQAMPWIHQVLYLLTGFRQLLRYFLEKNFPKIQRLSSLAMDAKVLFEFSTREQHLSKNSINKIKHKTNYLYLHLIDYFPSLQGQSYILNKDGDAICLFLCSGIALISTSLKFSRLEAATFIANHMMSVLRVFRTLEQLQALDKRLPTLFAQFLFFKARVLLFSTNLHQTYEEQLLKEAANYIDSAQKIRKCIDTGLSQELFYDTFNDGSDNLLISLHGPNLVKISSGKKEELIQALEAYKKVLGQNQVTDVACYAKIITIYFKLYDLVGIEEKKSILETIEKESQIALKIALAIESSLTAVFHNALGKLLELRGQWSQAKEMFLKSYEFEHGLNRTLGTVLTEATHHLNVLEALDCQTASASANLSL